MNDNGEIKVSSIEKLSIARNMLAEAKSLDDILHIRDIAEAARVYAQAAKLGLENQNEAAEVKIRAERKAGEMLAKMPKNKGADGSISTGNSVLPVMDDAPTLSDLGIEKMQSSRWQTIARLPEDEFEEHIAETKAERKELTTASVLRIARESNKENEPVKLPDDKYRVIYADPPWKYGNTMPDYMGVQDDHYHLMTIPEICSIPVKDITCDDAVLFLWVTSPILEESFQVINAWGFKYKASFVWDKVKHVMGHYNSVRHEFLLVCVKGSCQPDVQRLFDSVVTEERTEHSRKPEAFRNIIDTIYPNGKRIELFAREKHDNWDAFGNEI